MRGTCDAVASKLAAPVLHGEAPPGVAAHAAAQHARRRASAAQHAAGAIAAHLAGLQQRAACAPAAPLGANRTPMPCLLCSLRESGGSCAGLARPCPARPYTGPVQTYLQGPLVGELPRRLSAPQRVGQRGARRRAPGARLARRQRRPAARRRSRSSRAARSAAARASRPRQARRCPSRSPHRSPAPAKDRPSRAHPAQAPCGTVPQHPHAAVADAALPSPTGGMARRPQRAGSLVRAPAPMRPRAPRTSNVSVPPRQNTAALFATDGEAWRRRRPRSVTPPPAAASTTASYGAAVSHSSVTAAPWAAGVSQGAVAACTGGRPWAAGAGRAALLATPCIGFTPAQRLRSMCSAFYALHCRTTHE